MATARGLALVGKAAVGVAALCLIGLSPALREAAVQLQPAVPGALVTLALAGALTSLAMRRYGGRPRRRQWLERERAFGRALARWGWAAAILVALLPLWSHWAMRPPDSLTAYAAQLGHIPWKDTRLHLEGALRLLDQGTFGLYSERRPLTAAWLATRLVAAGGNGAAALTVQAVLFGLALFALGRAVGARLGLWSALVTCGVTLGLTQGSLPTFATEPLGVTLAACAAALLLSPAVARRANVLAAGVFTLGLALGARPGPQLLLPAVVAWAIAMAARGSRGRAAALLIAAALLAVGSTSAVNVLYGAGESSLTANAAYTLYGLSSGSNYRQFLKDYGVETMYAQGDRAASRWLYAKTLENLRERPGVFVRALASNLRKFLGKLPSNLSPAMSLAPLLARHPIECAATPVVSGAAALLGLVPLLVTALASAFFLVRCGDPVQRSFWLACALAVLGSVPVVYGDAGFRGLAVTYPFLGAALGLGLALRRPAFGALGARFERPTTLLALALALLIVVSSLAVPGIARPMWPRPTPSLLSGRRAGEEMVVDVRTMPAVVVARVARKGLAHVPWLSPGDYQRLLAFGGFADDAGIEQLPLPFVVASVYDFVTQKQYVLIAPLDLLRQPERFVALMVRPLGTGGKIYRAELREAFPARPAER